MCTELRTLRLRICGFVPIYVSCPHFGAVSKDAIDSSILLAYLALFQTNVQCIILCTQDCDLVVPGIMEFHCCEIPVVLGEFGCLVVSQESITSET